LQAYNQNNEPDMQLFYSPAVDNLSVITLNEEESRHCVSVLRLKKGDIINLVDGKGTLYKASITDPLKDRCLLSVIESHHDFSKRHYHLHIGIAPTKNMDRFEWFLEKAVETGIDEITPIICEHSERRTVNPERLGKLMISAMKQSVKAYLPKLHSICSYDDFISKNLTGKKCIAHCSAEKGDMLQKKIVKNDDAVILIGPEGDFSEEELKNAFANGYHPVSLGSSRFRTETAGVAACMSVYIINEL
jgi:16S rRNA (uracil1498-N3)-methyltransferase